VVRLKGGDPFVFGRGGEDLQSLRAAGIEAFVAPGITAALGCAAAAGAPLTHRDHAQAVTFVTGHARGGAEGAIDWAALAGANHTIVVYMGAAKAAEIAADLIGAGRAGDTPVLIVENGTRPDQRLIASRLERLGADGAALDPAKPALLIIGAVAALAEGVEAAALWTKASAA
jgi:uroporphyrin-III C-methyltransferase/precorrin-2 dehydrogenase/sirohydrochlorin ferrochelatase